MFDLIGALLSLTSTYYFIKLNSKAWFIGMLATLINGTLYWQKGLYADASLEGVYFLSMVYGAFLWSKPQSVKPVKQLTIKQYAYIIVGSTMLFTVLQAGLLYFFHSSVATLDAATTTLSLLGQGLMCYKIRATWLVWLITDTLYVCMYQTKNLPFHTSLMLIYITMSLVGYVFWGNKIPATQPDPKLA